MSLTRREFLEDVGLSSLSLILAPFLIKPTRSEPSRRKSLGSIIGEQGQGRMYAEKVIYDWTKDVDNPENALGKPDKEYAEILPHGELTLKMKQPFPPLMFYNHGYVIAKPGVNYSLAALIPTEDTYAWRGITPNNSGGFRIPKDDLTIVDTIIIKNIDTTSLYIDAVVGFTRSI